MTTQAQIQGLGAYEQWGFTLDHLGCEVVLLLHEGKQIAQFYQTGATEESLQAECAKHLVMKHGWSGCLWSREEDAD